MKKYPSLSAILGRNNSFNPKLAGFLNPKPMKVTVYITVDQRSDYALMYGFHTFSNLLKKTLRDRHVPLFIQIYASDGVYRILFINFSSKRATGTALLVVGLIMLTFGSISCCIMCFKIREAKQEQFQVRVK